MDKNVKLLDLAEMTEDEIEEYFQEVDNGVISLCAQWELDEKTQKRIDKISGQLSEVAGTFGILEDANDLLVVGFDFIVTHMEEVGREAQKQALNHLASKLNFAFHIEDLEKYDA